MTRWLRNPGLIELEKNYQRFNSYKNVYKYAKDLHRDLFVMKHLPRSWHCLMWAQIMVSIGYWNQIYPDVKVPSYSVIPNIGWSSFTYEYHSVNGISYGLAQRDPIKWQPLYLKRNKISKIYLTQIKENRTEIIQRTLLNEVALCQTITEPINELISLSVIPLSCAHCICF